MQQLRRLQLCAVGCRVCEHVDDDNKCDLHIPDTSQSCWMHAITSANYCCMRATDWFLPVGLVFTALKEKPSLAFVDELF